MTHDKTSYKKPEQNSRDGYPFCYPSPASPSQQVVLDAPHTRRIEHVTMDQLVKRFSDVLACERASFEIQAGEVHALLGKMVLANLS